MFYIIHQPVALMRQYDCQQVNVDVNKAGGNLLTKHEGLNT